MLEDCLNIEKKTENKHNLALTALENFSAFLTFFLDSADQLYHKFLKDTIVKVDFSGEVLWASPVNFRSFCLLDVRFFPFDVQLCEMKFGPWSHDGNELVINGSGLVFV